MMNWVHGTYQWFITDGNWTVDGNGTLPNVLEERGASLKASCLSIPTVFESVMEEKHCCPIPENC